MRGGLLLSLVLWLAPVAAQAANCTISGSGVAFGTYAQFSSSPTDAVGTLTVNCSGNQTITLSVALNAGVNAGGSFANRRLSSGASFLLYQLYTDAARTAVWGDGTAGTAVNGGSFSCTPPCTKITHVFDVYGRIPALQRPRAGSYSDTVTATVTFN